MSLLSGGVCDFRAVSCHVVRGWVVGWGTPPLRVPLPPTNRETQVSHHISHISLLPCYTRAMNGPACAYCGKRYDFANRPVGIENCCPDCLPPVCYTECMPFTNMIYAILVVSIVLVLCGVLFQADPFVR